MNGQDGTRDGARTADGDRALLMKTWSDGEADVVRQLLGSYGIPCQVVSDITHAVYRFSMDGLGEVRIFVPASRLEEATAILEEHRRHPLEGVTETGTSEEDSTRKGEPSSAPPHEPEEEKP